MDTRMLAYEHASTVTEIASWANSLIGQTVPDAPEYQIVRVVRFQVVEQKEQYAALILVEVINTEPGGDIALKEADIVAIEELTSSMDEAPTVGPGLSETRE